MPPALSAGVTIGIDIGGTNIRAARVEPDGRLSRHLKVLREAEVVLTIVGGKVGYDGR